MTDSVKHSSLQWYGIINGRKKLYSTGPMRASRPRNWASSEILEHSLYVSAYLGEKLIRSLCFLSVLFINKSYPSYSLQKSKNLRQNATAYPLYGHCNLVSEGATLRTLTHMRCGYSNLPEQCNGTTHYFKCKHLFEKLTFHLT